MWILHNYNFYVCHRLDDDADSLYIYDLTLHEFGEFEVCIEAYEVLQVNTATKSFRGNMSVGSQMHEIMTENEALFLLHNLRETLAHEVYQSVLGKDTCRLPYACIQST